MSKTILIADDEPNVIKTMVQYFQKYQQNYNIYQAPNGKVAFQIACNKPLDLVILDWDMPVMNGLETIQHLKNQEKTKEIPIVVATGTMVKDIHLSEALEKGAVDYVRKPVNPLELVARIRSALRLSESYQKIKEQKHQITDLYLKEKELTQQVIDHKNRELSSNTIQLANKNSLLLEIQKLLQNPTSVDNKNQILKLIQNDIRLNKQWERFKLHFEEVHPQFFNKLEKCFPSLSESELKICAYIKMRLDNKEIMSLLNLAPKGLETARYRIKKQMKLSKKEDLNEFVRNT